MSVFFVVLLFIGISILNCDGQRHCDNTRLRRCQNEVESYNRRRPGELSSNDCRRYAEQFNCMLEEIIPCLRDNKDVYENQIREAKLKYNENCRDEYWRKRDCYARNDYDIKRCEDKLPRRTYEISPENCRIYESFMSCIKDIVSRRCNKEDELHLQMYLMDAAQDLSWNCGAGVGTGITLNTDRPPYINGTRLDEEICCRNERCDNNRLFQCKEDLNRIVQRRDGTYLSTPEKCSKVLNKFNCVLWHNYRCSDKFNKDARDLQEAIRFIETTCDVRGDIHKARCLNEREIRDCERHLQSETSSSNDVTCREYRAFYDCMEHGPRRYCGNPSDELLIGYYLYSKAREQIWQCSYNDYSDDYSTPFVKNDGSCEYNVQQNSRHCMDDMAQREEDAKNSRNSKERHKKSCCAAVLHRECLRNVMRNQCGGREYSDIIDRMMGSAATYRLQSCTEYNYSICSTATRALCSSLYMAIAIFCIGIIFQKKFL